MNLPKQSRQNLLFHQMLFYQIDFKLHISAPSSLNVPCVEYNSTLLYGSVGKTISVNTNFPLSTNTSTDASSTKILTSLEFCSSYFAFDLLAKLSEKEF